VANGWLAKPIFIMRKIITGARDYKDDKLKNYKAHVLRSDITNQRIVADAKAFIANGKQTLILVDQIEHGQYLADLLEIPFATGEDGNADELINDLNSRKIVGLIATDGVVGEGVDTRTVEVLILANFIAAKGAVMQAVGRALRIVDNKTSAIILDYDLVDSTMLHRHASQRLKIYKDITKDVKLL
jgi:superfamily II DNA or RNA helicase